MLLGVQGKWEGWGPWQIRGQRKAIHTDTGRALRTRAGAPKQEGDRCWRARVHGWETGAAECAPRGALRRWRSPGEWGGRPRGTLEPPAVCPPRTRCSPCPVASKEGREPRPASGPSEPAEWVPDPTWGPKSCPLHSPTACPVAAGAGPPDLGPHRRQQKRGAGKMTLTGSLSTRSWGPVGRQSWLSGLHRPRGAQESG